jgi:hypothetical protein
LCFCAAHGVFGRFQPKHGGMGSVARDIVIIFSQSQGEIA